MYYLDYLNEAEPTAATKFRHRKDAEDRRKLPKKLSMSHIEDPLLSQAGCYVPDEPLTPPSSLPLSPVDEKTPLDFVDKMVDSPIYQSATPTEVDSMSDHSSFNEEDESHESESHLLLHGRIYALAEKYDIPSLKQLAKNKFEIEMACYFDSPEFAEAVEEVYCTTIDSDRGLRDIVMQAFKNHPQLANAQDVYTVIQDTPSLAVDLFKMERGIL